MRNRPIDRRTFLRSSSGALIALPLLESMAQAAPPPKRFIGILTPNGRVADDFFPTGGETDFTLGAEMASFEPFKKDLLLFRGLDNLAGTKGAQDGHREGTCAMLTGWGLQGKSTAVATVGGISLDQRIAATIGGTVRRPSLSTGLEVGGTINNISWDAMKQEVPKTSSPTSLFKKIFADFNADPTVISKQIARRQSILSGLRESYTKLTKQVSTEDAKRVDAHLSAIRTVESKLSITVAGCTVPPAASIKEGGDGVTMPERTKQLMDLVALALACDITRVVTFSFRHPGGGASYFPWLGLNADPTKATINEHHEMSHGDMKFRDQLKAIMTWHMEQIAYLVGKMSASAEAGGSVLSNSVIMHGQDCALGGAHSKKDMGYFLIGSAGGALKTGRHLKFNSVPHNNLLVSLLNAFGIPDQTFGDPTCCTGPLPGIAA